MTDQRILTPRGNSRERQPQAAVFCFYVAQASACAVLLIHKLLRMIFLADPPPHKSRVLIFLPKHGEGVAWHRRRTSPIASEQGHSFLRILIKTMSMTLRRRL